MTTSKKHKPFVYMVGFAAALTGLLFGLDTGVISGALPFIAKTFQLSVSQSERLATAVLIGAVLGTLFSGIISRRFGRHFAIWVSAFIFCVTAVLCALSVNLYMLIAMRVLLGMAIGLASFTAPLYLSEIAPKNIRGALIALFQFMITIGILVSYLTDTAFTPSGDWRWMFGVTFFPAFIMFLIVLILPKSPRWLMLQGRSAEARAVLSRVRRHEEIDEEINDIETTLNKMHRFRDLFKSSGFLKVLILGIALQMIQQFSGINTIIYYAPTIFKMAGFITPMAQMYATILVGTVNVLTTIIAVMYVDRWGRKPILYFGLITTSLSLLCLSYLFHVGIHTETSQYLAVALVLTFIFGFAISLGPIAWIICAEIFPLQGRDAGVAVTTATNWISNAIVVATFLTLVADHGASSTFGLFGILGLISLVIVIRFIPETKGVSLEKIEANLLAGKACRHLGD
jgi:SP family galactose:H+ symporter-like MFS transporter